MGKLLVKVEINIWKNGSPAVFTKPVIRETEKSLFVKTPHRVRDREQPMMKVGPFNKNLLERVGSPRPGIKRSYFVTDSAARIRETPEYRLAVIHMMDEIQAELIQGETNLAAIEDGLYERERFEKDMTEARTSSAHR